MSRRAHNDVFGDTVSPERVTVTCDECGEGFYVDETTAEGARESGGELLCELCETGVSFAPSQMELEEPTVDETKEPRGPGPDAEPDLEASIPDRIGFNEVARQTVFEITLSKGTKQIGTVTVRPGDVDSVYLPVDINPGLEVLSDEAAETVISKLSRRTNLLIDTGEFTDD